MAKRILGSIVVCGWLMASVPLQAHHSIAGEYNMKTPITKSGTVTKVLFVNPHGSLTVEVTNQDSTKTDWVMTLGGVTSLAQKGVGSRGPNALHIGDKISVRFLPAKDGSPLGFLRDITMPDGRVVVISGEDTNQ